MSRNKSIRETIESRPYMRAQRIDHMVEIVMISLSREKTIPTKMLKVGMADSFRKPFNSTHVRLDLPVLGGMAQKKFQGQLMLPPSMQNAAYFRRL